MTTLIQGWCLDDADKIYVCIIHVGSRRSFSSESFSFPNLLKSKLVNCVWFTLWHECRQCLQKSFSPTVDDSEVRENISIFITQHPLCVCFLKISGTYWTSSSTARRFLLCFSNCCRCCRFQMKSQTRWN